MFARNINSAFVISYKEKQNSKLWFLAYSYKVDKVISVRLLLFWEIVRQVVHSCTSLRRLNPLAYIVLSTLNDCNGTFLFRPCWFPALLVQKLPWNSKLQHRYNPRFENSSASSENKIKTHLYDVTFLLVKVLNFTK